MQEEGKIEEYVKEEDFGYNKESRGWKEKLKDFIGGKYFIPIVIILITIIAFSLGRISGLQDKRESVRIINNLPPTSTKATTSLILKEGSPGLINPSGEVKGVSTDSPGRVVASKNGTKYHYPWCAGAKQISAQNLVTFNSIEEARLKGLTPASNCKGLK